MRIAIDASCLANARGYGRFARELLSAMMQVAHTHEYVLLADARAADAVRTLPALSAAELIVVPQSVSPTLAASAGSSRSLSDMWQFTRATQRVNADVFFSPSVYTFFPLPLGMRAVITVHDAIAERYPALTLPSRRARVFWNLKTRVALAQATLVLTVSDFAARELTEVHGIAPSRLRVAVEAPSATYTPSDAPMEIARVAHACGVPLGARWFAYVGGFNPHKRLDVLMRAFADMSNARVEGWRPHLVMVGTLSEDVFHKDVEDPRALAATLGIAEQVHWPGFVADEELRHLLSGAVALALPSENEGFGLPAVEAAACGTAVIATTASPLPELLAGGGIFVTPGDVAALSQGMQRLLTEEPTRRAMAAAALVAARRLSWTTAAESTLRSLAEAAGS